MSFQLSSMVTSYHICSFFFFFSTYYAVNIVLSVKYCPVSKTIHKHGITDAMDMSLSRLRELVMEGEA